MRNLYRRKPEFVIAERWTKNYKPSEVITTGMKGFPLFWEDEFQHRYTMLDSDGWVPVENIQPGSSWAGGVVIRKGDWLVTEKGAKLRVLTDEQFRSEYVAADFFERAHTCQQDEAEGDPGET